jgi:thiamine-phosphate pyrophosphorylase
MFLKSQTPLIYLITSGETNAQTRPRSEDFLQILRLAESAVATGINLFQIREKNLTTRTLYELTRNVSAITRGTETALLVNDRADVAATAGADGVHLASDSLKADVIRKTFGANFVIGVSTHSLAEASIAKDKGADFAVFGPVFETDSKRGFGAPVGVEKLREVTLKLAPFPVLALGGVQLENVDECFRAGARGVAAISMLNDPVELPRVVQSIRREGFT